MKMRKRVATVAAILGVLLIGAAFAASADQVTYYYSCGRTVTVPAYSHYCYYPTTYCYYPTSYYCYYPASYYCYYPTSYSCYYPTSPYYYQITCTATPQWQSTGIWVEAGDTVVISASGCAPHSHCTCCLKSRLVGAFRLCDGRYDSFEVGEDRTFTASRSGYLYLGTNAPANDPCIYNHCGYWNVGIEIHRK